MTGTGNPSASKPNKRRVIVNIIDDVAAADPSRVLMFMARSSEPADGWVPITFKEVANAINHVAHELLCSDIKRGPLQNPIPTVAYIGPNDVRYIVVMLGCVKAGCTALFMSPRNSQEIQLSLFEQTDCRHLWFSEEWRQTVQPWLRQRSMQATMVPDPDVWLHSSAAPIPFNRTDEETRREPLVVLCTSGSTGFPKPIVVRHGAFLHLDALRGLPKCRDCRFLMNEWSARCSRVLCIWPLFHAAGLLSAVHFTVYYGRPLVLPMPGKPLTPALVMECLAHAGVDAAFMPPSLVEALSHSEAGVQALKKLNFVGCGGAALSRTIGDRLAHSGVLLSNVISSTESMPLPVYFQPDPKLWQYFTLGVEAFGAKWRPVSSQERVYELVLRRENKDVFDQAIFCNFPELTEWPTGDLFEPHPTLSHLWTYRGRCDDIIVLSNGEKLSPLAIETIVASHPSLLGALVVGQDRFQPALILEPAIPPPDDAAAEALIDDVWPLVEKANEASVAHGQIHRQLVAVSDPNMPFARAGKGTIQRGVTNKTYADYIDSIYREADVKDVQGSITLDTSSEEELTRSILHLFANKIGLRDLGVSTDFFQAGLDSLQVIYASRLLKTGLAICGVHNVVTPHVIYANPTPERLSSYLYLVLHQGGAQGQGNIAQETEALEQLVLKYTTSFPAPNISQTGPLDAHQTVLLTGSTGSLGSYLLDQLCSAPQVERVIALNRALDGGSSRQTSSNAKRGISTDMSKVEFLHADLSLPDLGLGPVKYAGLLETVDRIIHNAWPVNLNLSVSSFEPHVRGVRNLANLAMAASKRAPLLFISSISTVEGWRETGPVPERRLTDLTLAQGGYGRSKLAASLVLDAAARHCDLPTASVRVGQIAGPRGLKGMWNAQEHVPSLVASSLHLGVLPQHLGNRIVDWVPVEDAAGFILDIIGVTTVVPESDISGYFHCVNPSRTQWATVAQALKEFHGGRIRELVSMEKWVAALERNATDTPDLDRSPALKLLDVYRAFDKDFREGREPVELEMRRSIHRSPRMARMAPVTPELVRNWCRQWGF